jgi:hypothetical protein
MLLVGVLAVVAVTLVIVGVLALRAALSSKKPVHVPPNTSTRNEAQQTPATPVLMIKVISDPCRVFVKNNGNVLQSDNSSVRQGTTLQFNQTPLLVQISNPACVVVLVHGLQQVPDQRKPWIFFIQS